MISIREATIDDAVMIADISRQAFYDTFFADNSESDMKKFLDEQFTRGKLILEVGAPDNKFILACDGDEVAGYAKLREGKSHTTLSGLRTLEIARLYAVKEQIGKGVGKVLMQACIDEAIKRSKEVIWLGVWEKNKRAIDFYHRWGFEKFAETEFLLGDDLQNDWLMRKSLSAGTVF